MHYTYELSFNPLVQQVLEFFQESVVGDRLPSSRKISTAYSNLFRAINCLEQKHSSAAPVGDEDKDNEGDSNDADLTQSYNDFA